MTSLAPAGECQKSASNYVMAASFKACSNSLFTIILPLDMALTHMDDDSSAVWVSLDLMLFCHMLVDQMTMNT
jgi:membrane-bound metal-dependent hydrolase YbcI (DUF457 family)